MDGKTTSSSASLPGEASRQVPSIRLFPHPYRAALAICNDLDGITSFQELKAIHDVLNGRKDTRCGPGLGLEIGDSFHFYSVHPEQDDTLSYFEGTSGKPSADASALRDGMAAGLLDTLHTWGNYSQKGGFFRQHAERALEEMQKYSLQIPVWTNHGDIHNFQNLGRADSLGDLPSISSARGDRSRVLEYHMDITRQAGMRYVWIKELTQIVGQERSLEAEDWLESGMSLGRGLLKGLLKRGLESGIPQSIQFSNRLIKPTRLRDNSLVYEMLRLGSFDQDGSDNLPQLLTAKNLRRLAERSGCSLLYIHLGKGRPSADTPFSSESYQALSRLARWAHDGDIWVTTASRLCQYVELRQRLKLRTSYRNGAAQLVGSLEKTADLPNPDVSGLTVYSPGATDCEFQLDGKSWQMVQNRADHTGRVSFSVPMNPIEYCWE